MTSPIQDRVAAALGRNPRHSVTWDRGNTEWVQFVGSDLTEILDKFDALKASHARAVEDMGDAVEARQKAEQELSVAQARDWRLRRDVGASLRSAGVSVPDCSALDADAIVGGIHKLATCRDAYRDSYARAVDEHSEEMTEASRHAESLRLKLRDADREIAELRAKSRADQLAAERASESAISGQIAVADGFRNAVWKALESAGISLDGRILVSASAVREAIEELADERDEACGQRVARDRRVLELNAELDQARKQLDIVVKQRDEARAEFQKSVHAVKCEYDRSNRLIEAASEDTKRIKALEDTLAVAEQRIEALKDTLRGRDAVIAELRQKLDAQPESDIARRLATAEACISLLAQMPAEISKLAKRVAEIEGGAQ